MHGLVTNVTCICINYVQNSYNQKKTPLKKKKSNPYLIAFDQRRISRTQGRVGSDMNTLSLAELQKLPLRVLGVKLDLVGSRDDLGNRKDLLKVLDRVVGDTDGLGLAGLDELLHGLVGGDDVDVLKDQLAGLVPGDSCGARLESDRPVLLLLFVEKENNI